MTDRRPRPKGRPGSARWMAAPLLLVPIAIAAALVGAGGDIGAVDAPISTQRPLDPPLAPGLAPDLDLLFTAEVAGWIEPCG